MEVSLYFTKALRLAAEMAARVHVGVVVDHDERLERDVEPPCVRQHAAMMVRNAPRPGIDVEPGIELAALRLPAHLGINVPAAQGPCTATDTIVVIEHLHAIARIAQFERGEQPRPARTEHDDLSTGWCPRELYRTRVL
jgi:hypothetical protein